MCSFLLCPVACRLTVDRFNAPNARPNRFLPHDPERSDLTRGSDVGAATKLHRITVERLRFATDLQNADGIAVFLAKKLLYIGTSFHFGVRNFCPGNWRILSDFFVHQSLYVTELFLRQGRARKVERQLVRPDITSLLRRIATNDLVQRPMQQVCRGMMTLNQFASISIH